MIKAEILPIELTFKMSHGFHINYKVCNFYTFNYTQPTSHSEEAGHNKYFKCKSAVLESKTLLHPSK